MPDHGNKRSNSKVFHTQSVNNTSKELRLLKIRNPVKQEQSPLRGDMKRMFQQWSCISFDRMNVRESIHQNPDASGSCRKADLI